MKLSRTLYSLSLRIAKEFSGPWGETSQKTINDESKAFYGPFWAEQKERILQFIKDSIEFFSSDQVREWQTQILQNLTNKKFEKPIDFFKALYHGLDQILQQYATSKQYIFNLARTIVQYMDREIPKSELKKYKFRTLPEVIHYLKDREKEKDVPQVKF